MSNLVRLFDIIEGYWIDATCYTIFTFRTTLGPIRVMMNEYSSRGRSTPKDSIGIKAQIFVDEWHDFHEYGRFELAAYDNEHKLKNLAEEIAIKTIALMTFIPEHTSDTEQSPKEKDPPLTVKQIEQLPPLKVAVSKSKLYSHLHKLRNTHSHGCITLKDIPKGNIVRVAKVEDSYIYVDDVARSARYSGQGGSNWSISESQRELFNLLSSHLPLVLVLNDIKTSQHSEELIPCYLFVYEEEMLTPQGNYYLIQAGKFNGHPAFAKINPE